MNVQETLLYIRKNKKLAQRELLKYMDSSVYSKIESGKKNLKFSELLEILDNLSIPLAEFSQYLDNDTTGKMMRTLLEKYKKDPQSLTVKNEICTYFHTLNFDHDLSLDELSNYVGIKILFSARWQEIPSISQEELTKIFHILNEKKYYFHYDYAILSNTIYLFNDDQIESLMKKAFPVKDMKHRNVATKEFITNLISNLVTTFLTKKEYTKCIFYINSAKKEKENYDLSYKIMINFLENLVQYVQTRDERSKVNLETAINFLYTIGDDNLARVLQLELENIISYDKKPRTILRNNFN